MSQDRDASRWAEVLETFDELVELAPAVREERLAVIAGSDPKLRRALDELLAADAEVDARLARIDAALGSSGAHATGRAQPADALGLVGRTVSHFRIIEPLAEGGMGVVYRAEDARLGRAVALKFLRGAHGFDRSGKERFLQEARLAGALDHPNICGIHEAGETDDGHLFHAMPLYAGETLKARLAREGALPIADALSIAKQVAHGLSAAHGAGIVHRDLKPANLMLLPDGTVKILDFGLARARGLSLTASGITLGTAYYMAPEQVRGQPLDGRADLWALGVVVYEMVTGRRPFEGEETFTVTHAIVHAEPPRPAALRREIPSELEEVVLTLLSKDASGRYASAEHVATALAVLDLRGRDQLPLRTSRTRVPKRVAWPAAIGVALVLAAVVVAVWLSRRDAASTSAPRTVAVLPFDDRNAEGARHVAVGLGDAIATELARARSIVVPSHLSTVSYRASPLPPAQVASALGTAALVTGAVRRSGDSVQIDIQLLDATTERRLWGRRYARGLTEALDIQRDATRELVAALRADLRADERIRLERPATTSARAYDLYLRGRAAELRDPPSDFREPPIENLREAQSFYSQARDADPGFAMARARLATVLMAGAAGSGAVQARREQARLEAETALRLHPGLSEAHAALARYWWYGADRQRAVRELELALEGSPNQPELHIALGNRYRAVGRWEEAIAAYERAMRLDPRNPDAASHAALTYLRLRRDEDAMRAFDRAIRLSPDSLLFRVIKGHTYLRWRGSPDTLAAVLRSVPPDWDPEGMTTWARYTVLRVQRRHKEALAMLDASRSALSRDGLVYQPTSLMRAQMHEALGDVGKARTHYETARAFLEDSSRAHPQDASIRTTLGLAYASLGRKADAVREARRAMELAPVSQNSPGATAFMGGAVEVFARVGDLDTAFELLELLLAMPAGREVTVPYLRLWPGFDPLRNDPRFGQLLERFAASSKP